MTMTTIKVSSTLRDRLKVQAAAANATLGEYLEQLADEADHRDWRQRLRAQIASTPPEVMAAYERETREWLEADLGA
jgi:hypothetical protein